MTFLGPRLLFWKKNDDEKLSRCNQIWYRSTFWKQKLNFFKNKNQNSALCSTQWPPDNWPGVLDHLPIGLVNIKYTKLGKIGEKLLLILGLAHINFPLHRGAFCHFLFRWIYYCNRSKSTGKETGKIHLCALCWTIRKL